jgi:PAS domain-containing protein
MWRKEIEIILARQLASYLAMPMFIVDTTGELLYFNEPAEKILGRRFEETGWMASGEWTRAFQPKDEEGGDIPPEDLPLMRTLRTHRPSHRRFWIASHDGKSRIIETTAFPLVGIGDRFVGAVSIFWELDGEYNA